MNYWDSVRPTYIEQWPSALHSLSVASIDVPLTVEDAVRLGSNIAEFGEAFLMSEEEKRQSQASVDQAHSMLMSRMTVEQMRSAERIEPPIINRPPHDISDIRQRVMEAVEKMPAGAFVRLGSRSPKDSWEAYERGQKTVPGEDPLRFLLDSSERIYEDLKLAIEQNYPPHIWVRQWAKIEPWAEFRCFMEDRKLVGISQYNYLDHEVFPEITRDPNLIPWLIRDNFFPEFRRASHLNDVVFDVFLTRWTRRDNTSQWEVKLLEINPFFQLTDPCLFSWHSSFDGSFRYNKQEANPS